MPLPIHEMFFMFAALLAGAALFGAIAARMGIPSVIGELAAGIILGPSLLGWVEPIPTLKALAAIGIVLLLFEVGMDTDLRRMARAGSKPIVVASAGFLLPFALGYACAAWLFGLPTTTSLFIGGTLTATSIGITVRVLADLGRKDSPEAQIVIAAAVLDDLFGVIALAFLYQIAVTGNATASSLAGVGIYIILFMVLAPVAAKLIAWAIEALDRRSASPGLLLMLVVGLILAFSALAHAVGAPEIMGGFAAGLALGHAFRVRLPRRVPALLRLPLNRALAENPELSRRVEKQMRPLIHLFAPVFFVLVGVTMDLRQIPWESTSMWALFGTLLAVAILGKWLAGFVVAEPRLRQHAIGISLIPRGEVGLIFAQLGASYGLLSGATYAALLLVIILTTFLPPFALKAFYTRWGTQPALAQQSKPHSGE